MVKRQNSKAKKRAAANNSQKRLTRTQTRRLQFENAENQGNANEPSEEMDELTNINTRRKIPISRTRSDPNLLHSTLNCREYFEEKAMHSIEKIAHESVANLDLRLGALETLAEKFQRLDRKIGTIKQNEKDIEYLSSSLAKVDLEGRETNRLAYETSLEVHANFTRIGSIEKKHGELESRVAKQEKRLSNFIETGSTTGGRGFARLKIDRPSFSAAAYDKPIRFLSDLMAYIEMTGVDETNIKYVIKQSLKNATRSWWEFIEPQIKSLRDFREKFCKRYWSDEVQTEVRNELE